MPEIDIFLWVSGIIIAVLLAFLTGKRVTKKQSQNAKSEKGSSIIQSGRDTKIK